MTSSITAAGSASGMDFESIISASVQAKKAQLERTTTTKKEETNIAVSGLSKFKSALTTFQTAIQAFTEENAFNARKVTSDQPTDNPYFTVTTKDDANNAYYDVSVKQLASSEKINKTINSSDINGNKFSAGTIEIDLGTKDEDGNPQKFSVDIQEGDSLELIRKRINENDLGVTANLVKTTNGYQLTIDSGTTGADTSNIKITATDKGGSSNTSLSMFNYSSDAANSWTHTEGKNALISVNGQDVESTTNTFSDQISGIELTVNRVSDKDDEGNFKTNTLNISEDSDAVTKKMEEFVSAYNTLMSSLSSLYERNTYTDGENNYDGGELSGDSLVSGIKDQIQNIVTTSGVNGASNGLSSIFSMGIEFEKDGTLSINSDDFKEALKTNYNSVVNAFTGDNGLLKQMDDAIEVYVKSDGLIKDRQDQYDSTLSEIEDKEASNAEYLEKYEESLRQKYANLDTLMAGYNTSLSYLKSVL